MSIPSSSSVLRTLLMTALILCVSFMVVFQSMQDFGNEGFEVGFQKLAHGARVVHDYGPGAYEYQGRQLLRLFGARGTQGMPYIPTPASNGEPDPTPEPLEYFNGMIIVAGVAIGIAIVSCMTACVLWFCRCCCKRCCMGSTDPERHYGILRLFILSLGCAVLAGAFLGLYGGREVGLQIRFAMDSLLNALEIYGGALATLRVVAENLNYSGSGELPSIEDTLRTFADIVSLAQQFFSPVDAARMAILYSAMTVGMLAAIGLGLGACLRRKEVLGVSFVSATLAILVAWFTFAVNYPVAVVLDDSCVTLQTVLQNTSVQLGGVEFFIGCLPASLFAELNENTLEASVALANQLADDEATANMQNVNNFNPITVDSVQLNVTYQTGNMTIYAQELARQSAATQAAFQGFPCNSLCTNGTSFESTFEVFSNVSVGATALATLQDCSAIQELLDQINNGICGKLVVGVLLTFVGALVIGTLLIPMAIMGLYVAQKFPERAPAAKTKSRIMVIYVFLFFHCLVAVLAEVNTWWLEVLSTIGTIVASIIGFILINLPMNRWDWRIGSQVALALFLTLLYMACAAGWIYLFYFAILNNISCGQGVARLAQDILNLPPVGSDLGALQTLVPICSQTDYAHSLILAIFAGTASIMTAFAALLGLVLGCKIGCGTPLNLNDSDYEMD